MSRMRTEKPKTVIKAYAGYGTRWDEPPCLQWIALRFVSAAFVFKLDGNPRLGEVDRWKVVLEMGKLAAYHNIFDTEAEAIEALESYVEGMSA